MTPYDTRPGLLTRVAVAVLAYLGPLLLGLIVDGASDPAR
jgi:hypothetical protein